MKLNPKQYAKALFEAWEQTDPKDQDKVLDNFVQVLAENNNLKLFDEIANEFHKIELEKKGVKQAQIVSAHPVSSQKEKEIVDQINQLVKGKVELKKNIDENLIGGMVIKVDDLMIDASVKRQLKELKKDLSQ